MTKKQEEAAAKRLAEKVKKAKAKQNGDYQISSPESELSNAWATPTSPIATTIVESPGPERLSESTSLSSEPKGKEKQGPSRKFRGIPEDVQLFDVFWEQVVQLVKVCFPFQLFDFLIRHKARPDLSIQDITALLVSLTNLSVSCYPDRLEYVDQILGFAADKIGEHSEKLADLLSFMFLWSLTSLF